MWPLLSIFFHLQGALLNQLHSWGWELGRSLAGVGVGWPPRAPSVKHTSCRVDLVVGMIPRDFPIHDTLRLPGKTNVGKGGLVILDMQKTKRQNEKRQLACIPTLNE